MTFETLEQPLSAEDVMEVIEKYCCAKVEEDIMKLHFGILE